MVICLLPGPAGREQRRRRPTRDECKDRTRAEAEAAAAVGAVGPRRP